MRGRFAPIQCTDAARCGLMTRRGRPRGGAHSHRLPGTRSGWSLAASSSSGLHGGGLGPRRRPGALIGCRFCLELGYFMTHHDGLDVEVAREVPRWRDSDVFTPVERDVMEYAEAMSQTLPTKRRGSGGDVSAR